ncbi:MAG: hypothetical protein DRH51_00295 [Candidatus Coatesbacteria bacterium]|nr:MAG: hypothetical protein DRH49_05410 [Candidatus Coatesbacteria bacterium]RLC42598.1 MAG: hypothetical protein DRH51_00295 [Candidatus Coatesbacteria bacterium]RLC43561.1 MAG: hypothetical protein DRH44_04690 [Candidatus Coatesbacteria bacterium]
MDDLRDLVGESRQKFVDWCAEHIPGYSGYKEKETRREADKLLRVYIADKIKSHRDKITVLKERLLSEKKLDELTSLEKISSMLELLEDKVRYATYGYKGFFDAVKVKEKDLDRIYEFDAKLLQYVLDLEDDIENLKSAFDINGEKFKDALNNLESELHNFGDEMEERKKLILEV